MPTHETREGCEGRLDSRLRGNDRTVQCAQPGFRVRRLSLAYHGQSFALARATHRGVQRGEAPLRSSYPPRVGGRGLTARIETGAAGFACALPALHVDSRVRGNDKMGRGGSLGLMVEGKC